VLWAGLLVLALAGAALAAEERPRNWANYKGGPGRVVTWSDPAVKPPFKLKWVFWGEDSGTKDGILGVDGVILFANVGRFGGGNIYGVDAETGKELWRQRVSGPYVASMDSCSGLVFFPEKGKGLLAFEVKTGRPAWSRADLGGNVNPLAVEGRVFTPARDNKSILHAVAAKTGKTVWKRDAGVGSLGCASYGDGLVVVLGSDGTAGLSAKDGSPKWKSPRKGLRHGLYAVMIEEGRVYLPDNTSCSALSLKDGGVLWTGGRKIRAAGDGKVFGNLFGMDGKTGRRLWSAARKSIQSEGDICCAPFYHNGALYFGTGFGSSSKYVESFFGLDAASGKVLWRWKSGSVVCTSPIIYDGKLYFGSADRGLYCFEPAGKATGKDKRTGRKEPRPQPPSPVTDPAESRGWTALHGSDPACTGATQGEAFRLPLNKLWAFQTKGRVRSSAAVVGSTAYIGSCDGTVYAIDVRRGNRKWAFPTGAEIYSSPAVAGGRVFVGSRDGRIYAIDAKTGMEAWRHNVGRPVRGSGVVVDGVLYIGSGEVPHEDGIFEQKVPNLWALDAKTGKAKWQHNCGGIWGRPAVRDGVVYIATMGANITAVDAKTGKVKWDVHTQAGPFWASPVVYGKSLFIGSIDKNLKRLYVMDTETGHWRWIADAGGPSEPTVCVSDNVVYFWGWWSGVQALDMTKMLPEVRDTSVPPCRDGWIKGTHPGSLALGYRRGKDGRKLKVSQQYHRVLGKRGMGGNVVYNKLIKWRASTGKVRSGLVSAGGYLWVASQGMKQGKGRLLAVDIKTGGIAWTGQFGGECWSTPAPAGGRVVVGCDDGKVYCFGR